MKTNKERAEKLFEAIDAVYHSELMKDRPLIAKLAIVQTIKYYYDKAEKRGAKKERKRWISFVDDEFASAIPENEEIRILKEQIDEMECENEECKPAPPFDVEKVRGLIGDFMELPSEWAEATKDGIGMDAMEVSRKAISLEKQLLAALGIED